MKAPRAILHEDLHRGTFIAKKVVDLSKHQARDIAGAGAIDSVSEQRVIERALDEILDERPCIADQCRGTTCRH